MPKLEQIVRMRKLITQYEQGLVTATEVAERIVLDILPDAMLDDAVKVMPEPPMVTPLDFH